jgi:hypothetical protein
LRVIALHLGQLGYHGNEILRRERVVSPQRLRRGRNRHYQIVLGVEISKPQRHDVDSRHLQQQRLETPLLYGFELLRAWSKQPVFA